MYIYTHYAKEIFRRVTKISWHGVWWWGWGRASKMIALKIRTAAEWDECLKTLNIKWRIVKRVNTGE